MPTFLRQLMYVICSKLFNEGGGGQTYSKFCQRSLVMAPTENGIPTFFLKRSSQQQLALTFFHQIEGLNDSDGNVWRRLLFSPNARFLSQFLFKQVLDRFALGRCRIDPPHRLAGVSSLLVRFRPRERAAKERARYLQQVGPCTTHVLLYNTKPYLGPIRSNRYQATNIDTHRYVYDIFGTRQFVI